jgi:hypothetical protein
MAVLSRFSEAAARSDEGERFVAASRSPTVLLSVCRQTGVLGWAVVLPALLHPLWCVVVVYLVGAGLAGLILATVLQWAHCVEGATFLSVQHGQERLPGTWLRIQVEAHTERTPTPLAVLVCRWARSPDRASPFSTLPAHDLPSSGAHDRRVLPGQRNRLWPSPKSGGGDSRPLPLVASNG